MVFLTLCIGKENFFAFKTNCFVETCPWRNGLLILISVAIAIAPNTKPEIESKVKIFLIYQNR